jgi:hypothetical protein
VYSLSHPYIAQVFCITNSSGTELNFSSYLFGQNSQLIHCLMKDGFFGLKTFLNLISRRENFWPEEHQGCEFKVFIVLLRILLLDAKWIVKMQLELANADINFVYASHSQEYIGYLSFICCGPKMNSLNETVEIERRH